MPPYTASEVVNHLCRLPRDFRNGSISAVALVDASGYLDAPQALTRAAVLDVLRGEPALVDEWNLYSENQRRNEGWGFGQQGGMYVVAHSSIVGAIPVPGHPNGWRGGTYIVSERLTFHDRFEACAEFVVREVQSLARWAKRPN